MRRAALLAALLLAGCGGVEYIKFPAEAFLLEYVSIRDQFRDDTLPARKKCAVDRAALKPAIQAKCAELDVALERWNRRDRGVLAATLAGGTIDKETVEAALGYIGPVLKLAADIAL